MDALARVHLKSAEIASLAVVADAKDEAALAFYRKFGFTQLGSDPNRVFLPMGTIAELAAKQD
jgi:ribosomal protein S18 acetylase RimI-like enzyme